MLDIYCVRHGQASFGAENYDELSDLGVAQAHALGAHWAQLGLQFDAVWLGALKRHEQSAHALLTGLQGKNKPLPSKEIDLNAILNIANSLPVHQDAALNEYDSEALIRAQLQAHPQDLPHIQSTEGYKAHFRVLRSALIGWIAGDLKPQGMPTFSEFAGALQTCTQAVRQQFTTPDGLKKARVLMVSSGGPISTLVGMAAESPPVRMIELNYQMRNTAVSQVLLTQRGMLLHSFNTLPHLQTAEKQAWITSA
jgi:broad specificity phosphatase PhoE